MRGNTCEDLPRVRALTPCYVDDEDDGDNNCEDHEIAWPPSAFRATTSFEYLKDFSMFAERQLIVSID